MKIVYNTPDGLAIQDVEKAPKYEHLVVTGELLGQLNSMYLPKLVNGTVSETATPEYIAEVTKPKVPERVTNAQFRMALIECGYDIEAINAFIRSIDDEKTKQRMIALFDYANYFERSNQTLQMAAALLGITPEQLDQLFILAENF